MLFAPDFSRLGVALGREEQVLQAVLADTESTGYEIVVSGVCFRQRSTPRIELRRYVPPSLSLACSWTRSLRSVYQE